MPVDPLIDRDATVPLCVDLDGTLSTTDTLVESLLLLVRQRPWTLCLLPLWLLGGRARFKAEVARRAPVPAGRLPYRPDLVAYLKGEKLAGRSLVLASAANENVARGVADYLGLFDQVIASTAARNLNGRSKADRLVAEFGQRGFDYVGNATVDLIVWSRARAGVVVGSARLLAQARAVVSVEKVFPVDPAGAADWIRALRLRQWVKNLLVFIPLLAAHKATDLVLAVHALAAFVAFCLAASAIYVLNDLCDLEADRAHVRKRVRPFASGLLPASLGAVTIPVLLGAAFTLCMALPIAFAATLALYVIAATAYSLRLKQTTILDVLVLGGLYTVRLIGGAAAVEIRVSFWLLAFSMFLFLSLALVKRVAELRALPGQPEDGPRGRNYRREDLPVLLALGCASGYSAVLVFALYVNSSASEALYRRPEALWLLCPLLLFWISRVWLVTHRGEMHDDPLVFVSRDTISRWLVIPAALIVWLAL